MNDENNNGDIEITELPSGGRIIKPTGSIFRINAKTISEMSDIELKAHVIDIKSRLQTRKMEVDSLTIQLSQSNHEIAERDERKRIKLRGIRIPITQREKAKSSTATTQDAFQQTVEKLKKLGMTPEKILEIMQKLAGGKI